MSPGGQPHGDPGQPRPAGERDQEGRAEQPGRARADGASAAPTAASRALRIASIGADCPVMSSTCSVACQNSTSRPPTTVPPAAVPAGQRRGPGRVEDVEHGVPGPPRQRQQGGLRVDRHGADHQRRVEAGLGERRDLGDVQRLEHADDVLGPRGFARRLRRAAHPARTAPRPPPPPSPGADDGGVFDLLDAGQLQRHPDAGDVGVLRPPAGSVRIRVFAAPSSRGSGSTRRRPRRGLLARHGHREAAPLLAQAGEQHGQVVGPHVQRVVGPVVSPSAAYAARCSTGDSEWLTGRPRTAALLIRPGARAATAGTAHVLRVLLAGHGEPGLSGVRVDDDEVAPLARAGVSTARSASSPGL